MNTNIYIEIEANCVLISFIVEYLLGHGKMIIILYFNTRFNILVF